jgi:hypothetical protein
VLLLIYAEDAAERKFKHPFGVGYANLSENTSPGKICLQSLDGREKQA